MWGAIIGDISGSTYEYEQFGKVHKVKDPIILGKDSFYTDDTILTMALLDAYLHKKNYEEKLKEYAFKYEKQKNKGFDTVFSKGYMRWCRNLRDNKSIGNGAMMRISSIPYLSQSREEMEEEVVKATVPSHNTEEAVESALIISDIIYSLKNGVPKEELIAKYNDYINYHDFTSFNATCYKTLNNCLYALFNSTDYEDAIKTVISYGGDTDTNACIVGSMAEVLHGVPEHLVVKARKKLPDCFNILLDEAYERDNKRIK